MIEINFWALMICKEFDISVNIQVYLSKLDEIAAEINKMLAGREKDMDKFLAVKTYIYESGAWNNNKPFSYDLDDPLGFVLEHQLMSSYIDTRKGNCVSMPTLFISLMEKLDPNIQIYGVKAPAHLFCRFNDRQTGDIWNVETTNGANPARNQWYIDKMQISQIAVDKRTYLSSLTKKQYIAELLSTLISKERRIGNFDKAMKYTDLVLRLSPNSVLGLVNKGALLAEIGFKKSMESELTIEEKTKINEEAAGYIDKAISLGWQPASKEEKDEYLNSVNQEKKKINRR